MAVSDILKKVREKAGEVWQRESANYNQNKAAREQQKGAQQYNDYIDRYNDFVNDYSMDTEMQYKQHTNYGQFVQEYSPKVRDLIEGADAATSALSRGYGNDKDIMTQGRKTLSDIRQQLKGLIGEGVPYGRAQAQREAEEQKSNPFGEVNDRVFGGINSYEARLAGRKAANEVGNAKFQEFSGIPTEHAGASAIAPKPTFNTFLPSEDALKLSDPMARVDILTREAENKRRANIDEEREAYLARKSRENPLWMSAFTVGLAPAKGVAALQQAADYLKDGQFEERPMYNFVNNVSSEVREEVSEKVGEKWGPVGSWAYNVGMSMADNVYTKIYSGLAGAGLGGKATERIIQTIMGAGATADTVIQLKEKGYDDDRAFFLGILAGVTEGITENLPTEALFDTKLLGKNALAYVMKNALAEGTEEAASSWMNLCYDTIADIIAGTDQGTLLSSIKAYQAQGKGKAEAIGLTVKDLALDMGLDFLGGAISGGIIGGAPAIGNAIGNRISGVPAGSNAIDFMSGAMADMQLTPERNKQMVLEYAPVLGNAGSTVINGMYEGYESVIPANKYIPEMTRYYEAGRTGKPINEVKTETDSGLTGQMREAAYMAGKTDARNAGNAVKAPAETMAKSLQDMAGNEVIAPQEMAQNRAVQPVVEEVQQSEPITRQQMPQADEQQKLDINPIMEEAAPQAEAQAQEELNYEKQTGTAEVGLRRSGERVDSAYPGGQTGAVAEGTGQTQSGRRFKRGGAADGEAFALTYGESVSTASLGIGGGSDTDAVRVVKSGMTKAMKNAKKEAAKRGKRVVFVSGNMTVNGEKVRGVIAGDRIFVQVDHARFTSEQIARHELGHDMIAQGEVDLDSVRDRMAEKYTPEQLDEIAEMYMAAYRDSGMTVEEAWEEMVCDSLGEMNIFEGTLDAAAGQYAEVLQEVKTQTETTKKEGRGPPTESEDKDPMQKAFEDAGKFSREETDSLGNQLSEQQMEYFADSKVRDSDGKLKMMYRGGNEEFTVFDRKKSKYSNLYGRGFYFTDSESHAKQYGAAKEYYLNIINPVSTTESTISKQQFKKFLEAVAENEDDFSFENYGYGATVESVLTSVYSKERSDFNMLYDVSQTAIGDMVATVELFNEVNGTNFDGLILDTETVAFYSEQIKEAKNKKPTTNPDVRFSREETSLADLRKENTKLRAQVEYWRNQTKVTDHPTLREEDVKKAVGELLQDYESTADKKQIAKSLKSLGETILAGGEDLSWTAVKDEAAAIARTIVNNSDADSEAMAEFDFDSAVAIEYVANDILSTVMTKELREVPATYADRQAQKIAKLKEQNKEKMSALREAKNAKIKEINKEKMSALREAENAKIKEARRAEIEKAKIKKARQAERKKAKAAVQKVRAKKNARIADVTQRYKDYRDKTHENRVAGELRDKILRHTRDLSQKLRKPTDKKHVPENLKNAVLIALEAINLESKYEYVYNKDGEYVRVERGTEFGAEKAKRTEAFEKVKAEYIAMANSGEYTFDPDMLDADNGEIKGFLSEIIAMKEKPIAAMNSKELKILWKAFQSLEKAISEANKLFTLGRNEEVSDLSHELHDENIDKKARTSWGVGQGVKDFLQLDMLSPKTFFHFFGKAGDKIYRILRKGRADSVKRLREAAIYTNNAIKNINVKKLEKKIVPVKLGGRDFKLPTTYLMELYILDKQDDARQHIIQGGIKFRDFKGKGNKMVSFVDPIQDITPKEIKEAVSTLEPEEVALADKLQQFLSGRVAEWGNEASMLVYNYKKFGNKDYWPIKSNSQEIQKSQETDTQVTSVSNMGHTKQRKPGASNSLMVGNIFDTYNAHVADMIKYSSWLAPMEDINRIRNYKERKSGGGSLWTVEGIIERVHGKGGSDYLIKLLSDLAKGMPVDRGKGIFDRFAGSYKGASVGTSLSVVAQQPTSIFRAFAKINPIYLVKGVNVTKAWTQAKQLSEVAQLKDWGFVDIDRGRQTKDLLFNTDSALSKIQNFQMSLAGLMDSLTWGRIWSMCVAETRSRHKGLDVNSVEFEEIVKERFADIIEDTQVFDDLLERSQVAREGGVKKMAAAFMSESIKSYNMIATSVYDFSKNPSKKTAAAVLVSSFCLLLSSVTNAAMKALVYAERDEDKEKKYGQKWIDSFFGKVNPNDPVGKKIKGRLAGTLGESLNPLTYIPFFKDAWSLYSGYDVARMDTQVIGKLIKSGEKLVKAINGSGGMTVGGAASNFALELSTIFGLSLPNLKREVWAAANLVAQETDNYMFQYYLETVYNKETHSESKKGFMDILYKAYENDREAYEIIYNKLYSEIYAVKLEEAKEEAKKDPEIDSADVEMAAMKETIKWFKSAIEDRMKKTQGVKRVEDLDHRWLPPYLEKSYTEMKRQLGTGDAADDYAFAKAHAEISDDGNGAYYDALYDAMEGDPEEYKAIYDDLYDTIYEENLEAVKADEDIDPADWEKEAEERTLNAITSNMEKRMKKAEGVKKVEELSDRWLNPYEDEAYDKTIGSLSGGKNNALIQEYAKGKVREDNDAQYDALVEAYSKDRNAYSTIYRDMISSGISEDKIRSAIETRWKNAQNLDSVEDLQKRWLSPEEETMYNKTLEEIKRSSIWSGATAEQRDKTLAKLYDLAVKTDKEDSDGTEMQKKIDGGKQYGLTEGEYLLFLTSRQIVDKPTDSGKMGYYTNAEIKAAIEMLGLSREESAYLWNISGSSRGPKNNPWR